MIATHVLASLIGAFIALVCTVYILTTAWPEPTTGGKIWLLITTIIVTTLGGNAGWELATFFFGGVW